MSHSTSGYSFFQVNLFGIKKKYGKVGLSMLDYKINKVCIAADPFDTRCQNFYPYDLALFNIPLMTVSLVPFF
jgi:hypothetical protein